MTPHPVPLDGTLRSERQILLHRRLGCPFYGQCLDRSIADGWESFSCLQCEIARVADKLPHDPGKYATARKGDRYG